MLPLRCRSQVARVAGASRSNVSRALVHLLLTGLFFRIQTTKPRVKSGIAVKKIDSESDDDSTKVRRK